MAHVRCFVVLDLPPAVSGVLDDVSKQLSPKLTSVRWVKPGNHHLTLLFLGDVDVDRLDDVSRAIDRVIASRTMFRVGLDGVGGFPATDSARVIWVGVTGNLLGLNALHRDFSAEIQSIGFETDSKALRPHLTIGRSRPPVVLPDSDVVPQIGFDLTSVSLIRSDLGKQGPRYTSLHTGFLGK